MLKCSKSYVFSLEKPILIATQRYNSEKGKNLAQAIYYKDTPKGTLLNVSFWHGSRTNTQCQTGYLKVTWIIYIVRWKQVSDIQKVLLFLLPMVALETTYEENCSWALFYFLYNQVMFFGCHREQNKLYHLKETWKLSQKSASRVKYYFVQGHL